MQIVGVYRCLPFKKGGYTSGSFRTVVIANNIIALSKEVAPHFTAKDVTQIKRFCRKRKFVSSDDLCLGVADQMAISSRVTLWIY